MTFRSYELSYWSLYSSVLSASDGEPANRKSSKQIQRLGIIKTKRNKSQGKVKTASLCFTQYFIFFLLSLQPIVGLYFAALQRAIASSFSRFLDHTRRATVDRTPLDEWSVRCRDLYLTTHNTHNRQTSVPPVGFEPTISAGERPKTYALDRAATGTGTQYFIFFFILAILPLYFVSGNKTVGLLFIVVICSRSPL